MQGELGIAPPTLPSPRAPTAVHAGKYVDGLRTHDEVERIREVRQDASSDIAMHDAEALRRFDNRCERLLHDGAKAVAQALRP